MKTAIWSALIVGAMVAIVASLAGTQGLMWFGIAAAASLVIAFIRKQRDSK